MRNFKKTLSLVLSVLMLVSCCSVVFSTFASAYTINDETTPNYGVYTYNFYDDATGNSAYPIYNHDLFSNSTTGKGNLSYIVTPSEATDERPAGAYLTTTYKRTIVGTDWAHRMFVRDPDPAISKADAINEGCYLALEKGITYTMILKYKLVSLNAKNYTSDAANAEIGIGFWDPKTAANYTIDNLHAQKACAGEIKGIIGSGSISALSTDWQYLNVTVDPEDLTFTANTTYATDASINEQYITIFASVSDANAGATFLIDSLTVVAVDNSVADKYTVYDNSTADGTLTENVKVARSASNVHTYDFVTESQGSIVDTYPSKNHDLMAGSIYDIDGGKVATTSKQPQSYVSTANDATRGLHFTSCYKGGQAVGVTNYGSKVFLRDPDVAISNSASLTGPCYLVLQNNTTYTFILKYKVEALTEGNSGYVGISFYDPSPHSATFPTFDDQGAGGGMHQILAVSELIRSTSDDWAYLVATVNADNVKFNKHNEDSYAGLNRYVTLFASSNNGTTAQGDTSNGYITAHFESVTVITESNTEKDDVTLVTMGDDGFKCYNATDYAGMTLPRPADTQKGYVGSHWVDANGNTVSTVPSSEGVNLLYSVYDNYKFDFEGNNTIQYDPNNKWGTGYANAATYVDSPIPGDEGNTVIKCTENRNTGTAANAKLSANFTNIAFNVSGNGDIGYKFKTSTTYRISFKYYCESSIWDESRGMRFQVFKSKAAGIGVDGNKTTTNYITDSAWSSRWHIMDPNEEMKWYDGYVEFETPADFGGYDYILLRCGGPNNVTDNTKWGVVYMDDFVITEVDDTACDKLAADSYVSIREEIAANEQTSALRVSAAISEADADDADEIGFIALPTKKATADWYKFDANGKLASGALSVKVKDVKGLGIKDAEGKDLGITELLAPKTVPVEKGQKAYQVIITGLQTIGETGAGLRNDAISVVLYTKDDKDNYTYYFVNEVSYDQTMTMYAMGGKDIAKYKYEY